MRNKFNMQDWVNEINRLNEADRILRLILSYYDIYSGQFKKVPDYDTDLCNPYSLNSAIRGYINFDDSE